MPPAPSERSDACRTEIVTYDSPGMTGAQREKEAAQAAARPASPIRPSAEPEFPGCRPFRLTKEDVEAYEGRFEYWSADTETAWKMCEPTSRTHEQPSQRLAALGQVIAAVRGAPIECYGSMDLILRNERGEKWRILQADQVTYLHPGRARLPVHGLADRRARSAGRRGRGGSHHRRAARQARPLRGVGIPRGMGGRPRSDVSRADPAGRHARADHPPARLAIATGQPKPSAAPSPVGPRRRSTPP